MTATTHPVPRRGLTFWLATAAGWALILYGLRGVLHHSIDTRPAQLARFWIGGALAHDLLLAPAILGIGVVLSRLVPRRRRTFQQALIICGPLALFTYPEIRGYGHALRNPTSLPHNYTANLLVVTAVVSLSLAVIAAVRRAAGPRRRAGGRSAARRCGPGSGAPYEPHSRARLRSARRPKHQRWRAAPPPV